MQRITIYENDKTVTSANVIQEIGAVLIPGFASSSATDPVPVGQLVECTSEAMFKSHFGKTAPTFKNTQYYPFSGEVTTIDTVETYTDLTSKYPIGDKAKDYDYTKEGGYKKGDYCIYNFTLYQAKNTITSPTEELDENSWNRLLVDSAVVQVNKNNDPAQEIYKGKTCYYQYIVETEAGGTHKGKFNFVSAYTGTGFPAVAIPKVLESETYATVKMFDAGAEDPSWHMALRLITAGFTVLYVRMNDITDSTLPEYDVTVAKAYEFMHDSLFAMDSDLGNYNPISDKGLNVSFITSGGYPVLEHNYGIDKMMIALAEYNSQKKVTGRGDCVALLDHTNNKYRDLVGPNSVFGATNAVPESTYAAVFTPWCKANIKGFTEIPASFVYLYTMVTSLVSGNVWDIYAGVNKGYCSIITGLNTQATLTNRIAEYYQNDYSEKEHEHCSINPITYIRNYGYCIWGDRTCEKYQAGNTGFALAFLHIRNLVNLVKKQAYTVSQALMFQHNDDVLWSNFRIGVGALLDKMVNSGGLKSYKFTKESNADDASKLNVKITLYPNYGLEKVVINIDLENDAETTVEEKIE